MHRPLASIIINNYNYARFLMQAIDSALNQTYPNIEVIVVDDGSTDDSRAVIEQYGRRIRSILKDNGGQPSAINAGFHASRGELVANLDSDDLYDSTAIEQVVDAWHSTTVKAHFPLRVINSSGVDCGILNPRAKLASGDVSKLLLARGKYISAPSTGNIYSRAVLERILPIPEDIWDHFDCYLETLAPFYGLVFAFDKPLGSYRIHDQNMSGMNGLNRRRLALLVEHNEQQWALLKEFCAKQGLPLSSTAGLSHWTHKKLVLTLQKMDGSSQALRTARELINSAWRSADELSISARLRLIGWALAVAALPRPAADSVLQMAYSRRGPFSLRA
jgi:glycosyltransferase involved in cell wall biosynthesis